MRRESALPIIMLTARADEIGQAGRAGARRRRLHHEAVQPQGAGRARARRAPSNVAAPPAAPSGRRRRPGDRRPADGGRASTAGAVDLTPTEFQLLLDAGPRSPGRVFTRSQLLDAVHGDGLRVVRARDRRAHQEPAPKARAGRRAAATDPDRLRRRLPARRAARRVSEEPAEPGPAEPPRPRRAPPWWPENEPWPPADRAWGPVGWGTVSLGPPPSTGICVRVRLSAGPARPPRGVRVRIDRLGARVAHGRRRSAALGARLRAVGGGRTGRRWPSTCSGESVA